MRCTKEAPAPPQGGGVRERGSPDVARIKWQSEDQSRLRNRAAKGPERRRIAKKKKICSSKRSPRRGDHFEVHVLGYPAPPPPADPSGASVMGANPPPRGGSAKWACTPPSPPPPPHTVPAAGTLRSPTKLHCSHIPPHFRSHKSPHQPPGWTADVLRGTPPA